MEMTDNRQVASLREIADALAHDANAMPDAAAFERYEHTAIEANIGPVAFDERIDLETRAYAIVLGFMSCGGIGWICLCVGAGLNFLFS